VQNKKLSSAQIALCLTLQERHGLKIPYHELCDYEFGKQFLNLFAFDPDSHQLTGLRRVNTIIDYYYWDKDRKHLQFKLDLSAEETDFMVSVLAKYKFGGAFPRENEKDANPEKTAYDDLEKQIYEQSLNIC
jgi:hypothetical protein